MTNRAEWLAISLRLFIKDELKNRSLGEYMEKLDRITVDPQICLGQPTIRGMRITVSVILKMLANSRSNREILEAYPELEEEDI